MDFNLIELQIIERLLSNRVNAGFDPDVDKLLHKVRKRINDDEKENKTNAAKVVSIMPSAFDLESMIEQLEQRRDFYYQEMEKEKNETDYFSEHIFEENHNKTMAFNEALEIIKSGLNTEVENGG